LAQVPQTYTNRARVFCKIAGFAHIHRVLALGDDYKLWLARPGYNQSEESYDFEEGIKIIAGIAQTKLV
jgi:hypothetical protein